MPDLIVEKIHKRLGHVEVLRGVSFQMSRGEVLAVLGPSGSGKTTILRSVAGLERPDRGKIEIAGKVVFDAGSEFEVPAEKRGLGLVFQSYAIWPHRTVWENVAYGLRLRRMREAEMQKRVEAVLDRLALGQLADRYPHQLSGGQQQRVALARALVYGPRLLLLDEPLSNLDAKLREEARLWLREIIKQTDSSALYVTHDQTEALAIADRILVLDTGEIQQEGTPHEIYASPANRFVAEFMGSNNQLRGRLVEVRQKRARFEGRGWSLWGELRGLKQLNEEVIGLIHVEQAQIATGPGENRLKMRLKSAFYLGERWEYLLMLEGIQLRVWGKERLDCGEHWVELPAGKLWLF